MSALRVKRLIKTGLPVAGAVAGTVLIIALLWQNVVLFSLREKSQLEQVTERLRQEDIAWQTGPERGRLWVNKGDVALSRREPEAQGLTGGCSRRNKFASPAAHRSNPNISLRCGLEAELAQSIMVIEAVGYARVHLNVGKPDSFVLNYWPDSTASVMLRLRDDRPLTNELVAAIISLVADSVPGLKPERVRVVDQFGSLLSATLNSQELHSSKIFSNILRSLRQRTVSKLAQVLTPAIGNENFRIIVIPRFDFNHPGHHQNRLLCETATATVGYQQANLPYEPANRLPALLSILPENQSIAYGVKQAALFTRSRFGDSPLAYPPVARLENVSVTVVLNQHAGEVRSWLAENPALTLLNQAAGIDTRRGDKLTLKLLDFSVAGPVAAAKPARGLTERSGFIRRSEQVGMLTLVFLAIFSALLPILHRLFCQQGITMPSEAGDVPGMPLLGQGASQQYGEESLPPPESGLDTKMACLLTLAGNETMRVSAVIRRWINSADAAEAKSETSFPVSDGQRSRQEQAAILLLSVGKEAAAGMLGEMSREEMLRLDETIGQLRDVRLIQVRLAMNNFFDDYRRA